MRVLDLVRHTHPDARLLLVGSAKFTAAGARFDSSAYEREVRSLVTSLGLGDRVLFLEERSDIPEILAASDLLMVPFVDEGFGRVVLEGMAMRVPVIASSTGGPSEIVRDRMDGALVNARDVDRWAEVAIELLADPARRQRMGEAGRERAVTDFTPTAHAENVAAVYRTVLGP